VGSTRKKGRGNKEKKTLLIMINQFWPKGMAESRSRKKYSEKPKE